jgi:hypothetical protein
MKTLKRQRTKRVTPVRTGWRTLRACDESNRANQVWRKLSDLDWAASILEQSNRTQSSESNQLELESESGMTKKGGKLCFHFAPFNGNLQPADFSFLSLLQVSPHHTHTHDDVSKSFSSKSSSLAFIHHRALNSSKVYVRFTTSICEVRLIDLFVWLLAQTSEHCFETILQTRPGLNQQGCKIYY